MTSYPPPSWPEQAVSAAPGSWGGAPNYGPPPAPQYGPPASSQGPAPYGPPPQGAAYGSPAWPQNPAPSGPQYGPQYGGSETWPQNPGPYGPEYGAAIESPEAMTAADRRLMIGGGACVAVSVLSIILRQVGVLPSGWATVAVILVMAVGLRLFVRYTAKSASSRHRASVSKFVALAGFAISVVTLVGALPVMFRGGGSGHFIANVFAHLWTLTILLIAVGTARTLNWLALVGMGLTGFLAVSGLSFSIAEPLVSKLGASSALGIAVIAPFVEELLKVLPVVLLVVIAARRRETRPSATELALTGAIIGAGFALYEDTQYHRGGFDFNAMPVASILNPTASNDHFYNVAYYSPGHMVFTLLAALGIAIGVLYRRRYRWAILALPLGFLVAVVEHCTQNYSTIAVSGSGSLALFNVLRVVTLWGWLSTLLVIAGVAFIAREEHRATGGGLPLKDTVLASFWLTPRRAQYAAGALAHAQLADVRAPQGALR